MPYIPQESRLEMDEWLRKISMVTNGEKAYVITKLLLKGTPVNYTGYSLMVGVIETVKLELFRSIVGPYEEERKERNGEL